MSKGENRQERGYWQSHVVAAATSSETVLFLEPTTPVLQGEILAMQNGEEILVIAEPRLTERGLAIRIIRGYRRSPVRPVSLLDVIWLVDSNRDQIVTDNWHNEAFKDEGWFTPEHPSLKPEHGKMEDNEPKKASQYGCGVCGSRTGLHGFSFDKKER